MALDTVGELVKVTIAAAYDNNQVQECNVGYQCTAIGGADTRALLGPAVQTFFNNRLLPNMGVTSTIYGWRVQQLAPLPPATTVFGVNQVNGTAGATTAPTQARPLLSFITDFSGRKYRGRIYLFTPTFDCSTPLSYPNAATLGTINNLGNDLRGSVVVGGSTWKSVILHKPSAPAGPWTSTPITNHKAGNFFATQRRSGNTGRLNPLPW